MCFKTYFPQKEKNLTKSAFFFARLNGKMYFCRLNQRSAQTMTQPFPTEPSKILLPRIYDPRGSLTVVEQRLQIPFDIARVYWIYDVPGGEERGAHSHRALQQLIVAVSGSLDIEVTDGFTSKVFTLNKPFEGLYLPPGIWRRMFNFSSGSSLMSIVSLPYDENEYIRDYDEFLSIAHERGPIITTKQA